MAKKVTSGKSNGAAGTMPASSIGRPTSGGSPGGSATNRISAAPKAQKNGTFQKASGKKPAVQVARANTPDRIANRMATIQSKKGGR